MTLTHGLSSTHPLYVMWMGMRARCNNPGHQAYHRYGGRGVVVDPRWDDFLVFLADMESAWQPGHELHRVDSDRGYTPDNCVWLSPQEHRALPKPAAHRAAISRAHAGRAKPPEHAAKSGLAHRAQLDPEWLREAYVDRSMSIYDIAAETGVGKSSVSRALARLGVTTRGHSRIVSPVPEEEDR